LKNWHIPEAYAGKKITIYQVYPDIEVVEPDDRRASFADLERHFGEIISLVNNVQINN
jgi:hypothetical protein